jgi:sulfur-oxidizing protein SoxY
MPKNRRAFLKKTVVFTASALAVSLPSVKAQWLAENFSPNILDDTAKPNIIDTDKIEIKLPKIAENGVAVPITVSSSLENIQTISILVEKNPLPLVAIFRLSAQLDAFVSARLKMVETSNIIVIVETHDGLYRAKEQVKIILGGCGY